MKQDKLTPARLRFLEEELNADGLKKPITQVKKAEQQVDKARKRLQGAEKKPSLQRQTVSPLIAVCERESWNASQQLLWIPSSNGWLRKKA